jgi:hypothetical protein
MSENSGLAVFMMYHALKLHFTTDSYDYFKYNGKTNVSTNSFLINKSKYTFYKLSRKYSLEESKDFFTSNFLVADTTWVGELLTPQAEENYQKFSKRIQSLSYLFKNDVQYLFETYSPPDLIKVTPNDHPILLKEMMRDKVMIETVVIMNDLMNFLPMWQKRIDDDIIWPQWQRRIKKYTPFVNYDKMKFRNMIKEFL